MAVLQNIDFVFQNWAASLGWPLEAVLRLALAAIAGGLVGLEREIRGRQAGFRTNLLVCLGSALVMVVSTHFADYPWKSQQGFNINIDPGRIAYGVMTGIGFLGAGAIIKQGASIRGLTTAAGLWCVAAVGLAAGFGLYLLVILASLLILLALWLLGYVEDWLPRYRYRTVTLRIPWHVGCIAQAVQKFRDAGIRVVDVTFERVGDLTHCDVYLHVEFVNRRQYYALEEHLEDGTKYQLIAVREH